MSDKQRAIAGWASEGLGKKEIKKKLNLKNGDKELVRKALEYNKDVVDGELISASIAMATGYYVYEDEAFKIKTYENIGGKEVPVEKIEIVQLRKHIPPNGTMAQFMLKHRVPRYRDEKEVDTELKVTFDFDDLAQEYSQ
jgi:hypothetical protein